MLPAKLASFKSWIICAPNLLSVTNCLCIPFLFVVMFSICYKNQEGNKIVELSVKNCHLLTIEIEHLQLISLSNDAKDNAIQLNFILSHVSLSSRS